MNGEIRAGNEYCNAMATSTAQKRARETGMVTKCAQKEKRPRNKSGR